MLRAARAAPVAARSLCNATAVYAAPLARMTLSSAATRSTTQLSGRAVSYPSGSINVSCFSTATDFRSRPLSTAAAGTSSRGAKRGPFKVTVTDISETELPDEQSLRTHVLKELTAAPRINVAPTIARRDLLNQLPLQQVVKMFTSYGRDEDGHSSKPPARRRDPQQIVTFELKDAAGRSVQAEDARGPFRSVRKTLIERTFASEADLRAYLVSDCQQPAADGSPRTNLNAKQMADMPLDQLIGEWRKANTKYNTDTSRRTVECTEGGQRPADSTESDANTLKQQQQQPQQQTQARAASTLQATIVDLTGSPPPRVRQPALDAQPTDMYEAAPLEELGDSERAESVLAPHVDVLAARVRQLFEEAAASLAHEPGVFNESAEQLGATVRAHFRARGFAMLVDTPDDRELESYMGSSRDSDRYQLHGDMDDAHSHSHSHSNQQGPQRA